MKLKSKSIAMLAYILASASCCRPKTSTRAARKCLARDIQKLCAIVSEFDRETVIKVAAELVIESDKLWENQSTFTIVQNGDNLDDQGRLEFTIRCDTCRSEGVPMFKDGGLDAVAMDAFKREHTGCGAEAGS